MEIIKVSADNVGSNSDIEDRVIMAHGCSTPVVLELPHSLGEFPLMVMNGSLLQ